jgi:phosphoketolase
MTLPAPPIAILTAPSTRVRTGDRRVVGGTALAEHCHTMLARQHDDVRDHLHDMPEVRDWTWTP